MGDYHLPFAGGVLDQPAGRFIAAHMAKWAESYFDQVTSGDYKPKDEADAETLEEVLKLQSKYRAELLTFS